MSFLALTIPATLLLAGTLLWLVIRSVRRGELDDMEGPAERHAFDDDRCPERTDAPAPAAGIAPAQVERGLAGSDS